MGASAGAREQSCLGSSGMATPPPQGAQNTLTSEVGLSKVGLEEPEEPEVDASKNEVDLSEVRTVDPDLKCSLALVVGL